MGQIFPCGPDTEDGEDQVGTCDITGECDGDAPCPSGDNDCPLRASVCCLDGPDPVDGC